MKLLLSTEESVKAAKDYLESKNPSRIPHDYPLVHRYLCDSPSYYYLNKAAQHRREEMQRNLSNYNTVSKRLR